MSSPFSGGGYIHVARGVAKSTKRGEFFYCWPSSAPGVGGLLLDLLLGLGIEVGYVKHPSNFDHYIILSGYARCPFDRLFARLHLDDPVADDHFLRFGERAVCYL